MSTSEEVCCNQKFCFGCRPTNYEFTLCVLDENSMMEFLYSHGVLRKTVHCPTCDSPVSITKKQGKMFYRCQRKQGNIKCSFIVSPRKSTFFDGIRVEIWKVCLFVLTWLTRNPPRQTFLEDELGWSSNTVVDWSSYSREVLIHWAVKKSQLIGGPGVQVEIDEAKFGKRKHNVGRIVEGQWVFGGIESENPQNCFLVPVPDRKSGTLVSLIEEYVRPGSIIISDCWKAYNLIDSQKFVHLTVNHSYNFVDPETGAHTQNVERMWREVRGTIPRYGRKELHFVGYLAEFHFKRNFPNHRDRVHAFFNAVGSLYPPEEY